MKAPVPRHERSSSPWMIRVGTVIFSSSLLRSNGEGRCICTPRKVRGAFRIVFTELIDEFLEAARVFHLELFAARSGTVDWREFFRAFGFPAFRNGLDFFPELSRLVRLGPHTGCADNDRKRTMRIVDAIVERGESAHRQADDMCLADLQMIEDVDRVVDGAPLRIFLDAIGNL